MDRHDRSLRQNRNHRILPEVVRLEPRQLLTVFAPFSSYSSNQQLSARAAIVRHEYDQYVGELKTLELKSQATPQEFLALRDDAREISAAASASPLAPQSRRNKAVEVSLQLDRSPLYGWAGDSAWAEVSARVTSNLDGLGIPQPLIESTLADMRALAVSAGVGDAEFQTFTNDFSTLRAGEASLPSNPFYHFEDPGLYYSQHLRGFFRGWGRQKVAAEAKLQNDLRTIRTATEATASEFAVIDRDVRLLESLGAALPSESSGQMFDSYVAAFAQGPPTADALAQLRSNLVTILGQATTAQRIKSVDQLVGDAPAFDQAAGSAVTHVQTIIDDVSAVVDSGGDQSLNPFKVTIKHKV